LYRHPYARLARGRLAQIEEHRQALMTAHAAARERARLGANPRAPINTDAASCQSNGREADCLVVGESIQSEASRC
jgi:hypothetical protein